VSQENVEIVRRAIAASTSEPPDVEALRTILDPKHELTTDWGVEQGRHHGVEGYLAAIGEMGPRGTRCPRRWSAFSTPGSGASWCSCA